MKKWAKYYNEIEISEICEMIHAKQKIDCVFQRILSKVWLSKEWGQNKPDGSNLT